MCSRPLIAYCKPKTFYESTANIHQTPNTTVELAWRRGSVMDCHMTAQGSIPGGNGVKNRASRPSQGTVNGGAVSK